MSSAASIARGAGRIAPPSPGAAEAETTPTRAQAVRVGVFAALGVYGAMHWSGMLANPPLGQAALAALAVAAGGGLMVLVDRAGRGRWVSWGLAALVLVAATAVAMVIVGLPARLLAPGNWGELIAGVEGGLSDLGGNVSYPYDGANRWSRLAILLGAPVLLALAAALAFWPARSARFQSLLGVRRRGERPRRELAPTLALVVLVVLYAVPATVAPAGEALVRGLLLFALVAGWIWLPRLGRRDLTVAAAAVAVAGGLAIGVSAVIDGGRSWLEYRHWFWGAVTPGVSYDWDHTYGPIDWPRDDRTVLEVTSEDPHYWKTSVLDQFNGRAWVRSNEDSRSPLEIPLQVELGSAPPISNQRWIERIDVRVGELRSDLAIGPGTIQGVRGLAGKGIEDSGGGAGGAASDDVVRLERPLEQGDVYSVIAYAPDPSEDQMRAAEASYPPGLARYTEIGLEGPPPDAGAALGLYARRALERRDSGGIAACSESDVECKELRRLLRELGPPSLLGINEVAVPPRGAPVSDGAAERAEALIKDSPYRRMYNLAQRLTASQPTVYDAVKSVEQHLQTNYTYNELPPEHRYALSDFLFKDRIGYCQQFSGAMALMLRMVGIPARVVTGFAPGQRDSETGVFRVRNLDAHSWVEVYFAGIGWVPFDPTPSAAPAESQASGGISAGPRGGLGSPERGGAEGPTAAGVPAIGEAGGGLMSTIWIVPLALALVGLTALTVVVARSRRRPLAAEGATDTRLRELESALERLGWRFPPGTTLLGLERRLRRVVGPTGTRYLAKLRAARYGSSAAESPSGVERRALRRGLGAGGGLWRRLRALLAMPPWGPRG